MHAALIALAILSQPVPSSRADRLATYIVSVSPTAAPYALELAERILYEATAQRLDPALLAAVCQSESWYQLYPRGGPGTHLAGLWQVYPDATWLAIPRARRLELQRSVVVSTWRAASILAYHVASCGAQTPACYARYQSGGPVVRRGYVVGLYLRARALRAVLGYPWGRGRARARQ